MLNVSNLFSSWYFDYSFICSTLLGIYSCFSAWGFINIWYISSVFKRSTKLFNYHWKFFYLKMRKQLLSNIFNYYLFIIVNSISYSQQLLHHLLVERLGLRISYIWSDVWYSIFLPATTLPASFLFLTIIFYYLNIQILNEKILNRIELMYLGESIICFPSCIMMKRVSYWWKRECD